MTTRDSAAEIAKAASVLLGRALKPVRLLAGGQHAITLLARDDAEELVVRAFPPGDDAVAREVKVLDRLGSLGPLVPSLVAFGEVAFDEGGSRPLIITSRVSGTAPDPLLEPLDMARPLAAVLARIHSISGVGLPQAPARPPDGESPMALRSRAGFADLDASERVLTHGDYWCGNLLWEGGRATGVVDWSGACHGPRGLDLAWCRQDLVLLGSREAAGLFLAEYERRADVAVADIRAWDVHAAARAVDRVETWEPNYSGIGRPDITDRILRERMDAWVASL